MSKKKALLVDDSKSARFFLRNMLQKSDIKVDMVESGEAALDFLKQKENQPDVIFMDHLMPGIDGFEIRNAVSDGTTSGVNVDLMDADDVWIRNCKIRNCNRLIHRATIYRNEKNCNCCHRY